MAVRTLEARRMMQLPAPSEVIPEEILMTSQRNAMSNRETDLYRILEGGPALPTGLKMPTLEFKHSALGVCSLNAVKAKQKKRIGSTSCLLPASRLLLRPPLVPKPRFLLGLEALSIQEVDPCWMATDPIMTDSESLNLAGNAFSGGCFGAMLLIGLSHLYLSSL